MPEEMESSVEKVHEHLNETVEKEREKWLKWCALLAAIYAVLAALSGLVASSYVNLAVMEQIRASDNWSYFQAKNIKSLILETQNTLLQQMPEKDQATPVAVDAEKIKKMRGEAEVIKAQAEQLSQASEKHMMQHETIAKAVTCFQVAIALIAIVILTKRRRFMLLSVVLGMVGLIFLSMGL